MSPVTRTPCSLDLVSNVCLSVALKERVVEATQVVEPLVLLQVCIWLASEGRCCDDMVHEINAPLVSPML